MTQIRHVFAGILVSAFTLSFVSQNDWYLLDSKTFSIEFPKKPDTKIQSVNTAIGELKMEITMYDASKDEGDNLVYGLITTEYPDSLINSSKPEKLLTFFRNSIDGAVNNVHGKLLCEKNIEIDGFPGREARVDYENGLAIIKVRIYLVNNIMFLLQTITETSKENNPVALKFHDSFKLKK